MNTLFKITMASLLAVSTQVMAGPFDRHGSPSESTIFLEPKEPSKEAQMKVDRTQPSSAFEFKGLLPESPSKEAHMASGLTETQERAVHRPHSLSTDFRELEPQAPSKEAMMY